jgi:hypothetical protein
MITLQLFQKDFQIGGTVEASTIREVLKVVTEKDLPQALKFVAEKLMDRRRRDRHYRERVDFGFVLTVLRQDYRRPDQANAGFSKRKHISVALAPPRATSVPPRYSEYNEEPRRATRNGFSRAGDIIRSSGLFERIKAL